jgi:hypothetical protein
MSVLSKSARDSKSVIAAAVKHPHVTVIVRSHMLDAPAAGPACSGQCPFTLDCRSSLTDSMASEEPRCEKAFAPVVDQGNDEAT